MICHELLDHTADLAVRFRGAGLRGLFECAGRALFAVLLENPPAAGHEVTTLTLDGLDAEDLLVRFLNELLYLFQVRGRIAARVDILSIDETALTARLHLIGFDEAVHEPAYDIKAATYHDLQIDRAEKEFRVVITFDL